jgi:hypothetical protein
MRGTEAVGSGWGDSIWDPKEGLNARGGGDALAREIMFVIMDVRSGQAECRLDEWKGLSVPCEAHRGGALKWTSDRNTNRMYEPINPTSKLH